MNLSGLTGVKKHTEETKEKMRLKAIGRKHTEETIEKMKIVNRAKAKRGSENPNWRGGKRTERKIAMRRWEYIVWRTAVFIRDNYTCQKCGIRGTFLHADHIKPWASYPELRYAIDNGRTLCVSCHRQTDTWGYKVLCRKGE